VIDYFFTVPDNNPLFYVIVNVVTRGRQPVGEGFDFIIAYPDRKW
jgi:hypothetical protein